MKVIGEERMCSYSREFKISNQDEFEEEDELQEFEVD